MPEKDQNKKHIPVLLNEVLSYLCPKENESYLDLTAGYGGHSSAILERTFQPHKATLVDRDQYAVMHLKSIFGEQGVRIIQSDFYSASKKLLAESSTFDIILADLGVSSPHLDMAQRGFAIMADGPLDMRMDQTQELTAATIVNEWSEQELYEVIRQYGEEPRAREIVRRIVANRPIVTTTQLATIVAQAWPGHSRTHPATRTFQALRIVVNDELNLLEKSLPIWVDLLAPEGRLGIITFHSLEDRIVKKFFAEHAAGGYDSPLRLLTKRPVTGNTIEIVSNPRARSAKLRVVAK